MEASWVEVVVVWIDADVGWTDIEVCWIDELAVGVGLSAALCFIKHWKIAAWKKNFYLLV